MNPNLQAIIQFLMQAITPSEAGAEIIPQDPRAAALLKQGLQMPGQMGKTVQALHARPEKVGLSTEPNAAMQLDNFLKGLAGKTDLGAFNPNMLQGGYQINLNTPASDWRNRNLAQAAQQAELLRTLAHESGHGLLQTSGQGGLKEPTSIPLINTLSQMIGLWLPGEPARRLPAQKNEAMADAVSGTNAYGTPGSQEIDLARRLFPQLFEPATETLASSE